MISANLVMHIMPDEDGVAFALKNENFRGTLLWVSTKLLREQPDADPNIWPGFRMLMGVYEVEAGTERAKGWAEA